MKKQTFDKRTKDHRPTPTARQMVQQWMRTGEPIRPVTLKGRGKRTANDDRTAEVLAYLCALGVKVEATGNDAPRGGLTGNWIKTDRASWRKMQPVVQAWIEEKETAEAQKQADKLARHKVTAQRFEGIKGLEALICWWKSEAYHPAPPEVLQAKQEAGMTWKEVRSYCKAHA